MAEDTEPLEVLSVGIEADISALVTGAQTGVEQVTEELSRIPPAPITVDTKSAVSSITELDKAFSALKSEKLDEIAQRLNEITLNAEQTEVALKFTSDVHEGIAAVVELAGQLGIGFGEAGRQLMETGKEVSDGLEDTLHFLEQLVSLTSPTQELVNALNQIQLTPELTGAVIEDPLSEAEVLAANLVLYTQEMGKSLGEAAQHFYELGQAGEAGLSQAHMVIVDVIEDLEELGGTTQTSAQEATQAISGVVEIHQTLTEQMLHARPAAALATSFKEMGEDVTLTFNNIEASGKSMLSMLALGVPKGGEIKIAVDAENAVQTLAQVEQAMVAANLITEETIHSFEELSAISLGEAPGRIPEFVPQPSKVEVDTDEAVSKIDHLKEAVDQLDKDLSTPVPSGKFLPPFEQVEPQVEKTASLIDRLKESVRRLVQAGVVGLSDKSLFGRLEEIGQRVKKVVSPVKQLGSAIGSLGERGRTAFQSLVSHLTGTKQAMSAAQLSAEQMNRALQAGAADTATGMERLIALVFRLSEASGESFESIISGLVDSGGITKKTGGEITAAIGQITGATGGLSGALGSLGAVASGVIGGILGVIGLDTFKKVIAKLREMTKETITYQAALVRLSVGIRAAQRVSGDQVGTIESWNARIRELDETYVNFSKVALTGATSQLVLLTREMELNEDQMNQVLDAAAVLATMYQIDLGQAIRLVVQGMTGMSRGLRKYGVFLSRAALNQEAFDMGLKETWGDLDVNERALVGLSLITQQTTPMVDDLGAVFKTAAGRLQAATARSDDAKTALGRLALPLEVMVKESGARFLDFLGRLATTLIQVTILAAASAVAWWELGKALLEGVGFEEAARRGEAAANDLIVAWSEAFALIGPGLADIEGPTLGFGDGFDEEAQKLLEMAQDYGAKIEDAIEDYHRAVEEAGIKLGEKLADQARNLERDLVDAYRDYLDGLEDLQLEYDRKLADQIDDTKDKLAELEREYELRRQKLTADYYNKLLNLQEKYQLDSARLRSRFIETLKDAVAKRDVWGAIQAIRKYARERAELKEDYNLRRTQIDRDFKLRMAELERQLEEKRRKLIEAQEDQAGELELWLKRKQEDLAKDYARDLEDLRISNDRKTAELQRSYRDQLEDLETNLQRRFVKIARGMADEESITREGAQAVFDILNAVFGLGGSIDQMMEGFEARLARKIEIDIAIQEAWSGAPGGTPGSSEPWPSFQHGGSIVAKHPTIVQFGEVPEMATFTPLNQIDHTQKNLGLLDIRVTADEYFSTDFEDKVEESIVAFVGSVIR